MPGKLKDILSHLSTEIDQETLLKYLEGRLSEEQKHEIEKKMLDSDFTNDAIEGLQEIKNKRIDESNVVVSSCCCLIKKDLV